MPSIPDINIQDYEVLFHAKKGDGSPMGMAMVSRVLFDPEINGSIVIGQAGAGKSMLLGQCVRLLTQRSPINQFRQKHINGGDININNLVIPQIYPFDLAVDRVRQKVGVHQMYWDQQVWDMVSNGIFEDLSNGLDRIKNKSLLQPLDPIWHAFNDSVVVGNWNKGTTAVAGLVKRRDVMVYGLISDPKNQQRAIELREKTAQLSPEAIQQSFQDSGINLDIDDFARVPVLMSKMANRRLIEDNNHQIEKLTDWILASGFASFDDFPLPESVLDQISFNYSSKERDDVYKYYQRRFIHMNYLLRVKLEAPQQKATPIFNVHLKDQPIHWYQKDLELSTT